MPSYEDNLLQAQRILDEINKQNIATPENPKGLPTEIVSRKLNYIRKQVFGRKMNDPILPALTANIAVTKFNIGACQELGQLASSYLLKSNRSDYALIFLGSQKEYASGNYKAGNHLIVMVGAISYEENMLPTKEVSTRNMLTIDDFFARQPSDVVIIDPLLNFVGSHQNCPELRQYCTLHQITDVLGLAPCTNMIAECKLPLPKIAQIVEKNAAQIAMEINQELNTSLMLSAKKNKPAEEIFPLLFSKSNFTIDDLKDPLGMTLLHYACLFGEKELVDYYMRMSPSLMELANNDGRTPLDCLGAGQGTIKQTLESAGETPSAQDILNIVTKVKQLKTALIGKGFHSDWLLRKAAYDGELDTVTSLANRKPENINNVGLPSKNTALHQAARKGHAHICSFLMTIDKISIDAEDKDGNTPLLLAIKDKHFHLVPLFLKAGADINKTNAANESASSLLKSLGRENLLNVDSETSAGIVSAAKNLLHFPPAKPPGPAATGSTPKVEF